MAVLVKEGVKFDVIAPGGFVILAALVAISNQLRYDITITSGTDGIHSGESDPHHFGRAYDIRCHDYPEKQQLLTSLINILAASYPGIFFAWIEDEGSTNEHLHVQVRHGMEIPSALNRSSNT